MVKTITPFRYPGGKTKLAPVMEEILKANNLEGCVFFEAFAGGAGLGLELLKKGKIKWLVLNDIDDAICSFWSAAIYEPWKLIEMILTAPLNLPEWLKETEIYSGRTIPEKDKTVAKGFSALYLNRVNFSGIIKGGVIGGKEQKGKYKMDCRFNRTELASRILEIYELADHILAIKNDVLTEFFKVCRGKVQNFYINELCISDPYYVQSMRKERAFVEDFKSDLDKTFFYFDPPYYEKGKTLYTYYFTPEQHEEFARLLKENKMPNWALSYDNCEKIRELYKDYEYIPVKFNHSVKNKGEQQELLFFSKNLKLM